MNWNTITDVTSAISYLQQFAPISYEIINDYIAQNKDYKVDVIGKLSQQLPYMPDFVDLARLHGLVVQEKRTQILEFGCGFSTLVMAEALSHLDSQLSRKLLREARRENPFRILSVDDQEKFMLISKNRIPESLRAYVEFTFSNVSCGTHDSRFCTFYDNLPVCMPDLIYIDGPDQFQVKGEIRGWSTRSNDTVPMSADLLAMEYLLPSEAIVIVDGRGANVQFLLNYLTRKWEYEYCIDADQHILYLKSPSIGKYNDRLIDFYNQS